MAKRARIRRLEMDKDQAEQFTSAVVRVLRQNREGLMQLFNQVIAVLRSLKV